MGKLEWAVADVLVPVAAVVLALVAVAGRRRVLQGRGGFDMCLRLRPGRWGGGWVFGIGRYESDHVDWFRTFGIGLRPKRRIARSCLSVKANGQPSPEDANQLPPNHLVLSCTEGEHTLDISMDRRTATGFLAWLEAAPPGRDQQLA